MDEKKLEQAQNLEDQQLGDVNGGTRILSANEADGDDGRSFPFPFRAANEEGDDGRSFPFPFRAPNDAAEGDE